jgi:exonuclease I
MLTASGAPSYKQQSIAAGYGLTYQAHSAIEDVKALIEIYNRMTGTQQRSVKRNLLGF